MAEISAAGAVLWRPRAGGGHEVAVVHRPRYDDWSLPKGKLTPRESIWAAAVREVAEETGFAAVLGRRLGQIAYRVTQPVPASKTVDYFAARAGGGSFRPGKEVDELRWLPPESAHDLLSYQGDRAILRTFAALPADTATLALVRHARAGRRGHWTGPDVLRPLSRDGRRQAKALRSLLALFGVDRVHSAPLVRCDQTVRVVADSLGVPIIAEPLLSEEGYDPLLSVPRLRVIAADGGTPVVCSQGGVIPGLLSQLANDAGLSLPHTGSAKGSTWILSFSRETAPGLLAADYIPSP